MKSLFRECRHSHIALKLDNSCAIAYLNKQGGNSSASLSSLARKIWLWCFERKIFISASHIPGVENYFADHESRHFESTTECKLHPHVVGSLFRKWGQAQIDLFASRLNAQVPRFFSLRPDPKAQAVDAFAQQWSHRLNYAFPPFCLVGRSVQKMLPDRAELIMITPMWRIAIDAPVRLALVRDSWIGRGLSESAAQAFFSAWALGTRKQYDSALSRWHCWCVRHRRNPFRPSSVDVINFLSSLFDEGLQYNTLAVHRAAISSFVYILHPDIHFDHELIKRVMKGFFRQRPSRPKYSSIWDVSQVMLHLRELGNNDSLILKALIRSFSKR